ncbi:hypothetical protein SCOCK_20224 [Actinacidiphila cocklensis]|uniref:Uncharacterized protein n=1 Tax=Actinacidiphila cocklensis TaxID=887465 RepID=A0A9W4GQE9_9ACTN|nr:hypothetical protein SCOCK_20224 [Actinacidiphila cocklensis]
MHRLRVADQFGLGAVGVLVRVVAQRLHHRVGDLLRVLDGAVRALEGQHPAAGVTALQIARLGLLRVRHPVGGQQGHGVLVQAVGVAEVRVVALELVVRRDGLRRGQLVLLAVVLQAAVALAHDEEDAGADRREGDDRADDDPGALALPALRRLLAVAVRLLLLLRVAVPGLLGRHLAVAGLLRWDLAVPGLRLAVSRLLLRVAVPGLLLRVAVARWRLGRLLRLLPVRIGRLLAIRVRRRLVVAHGLGFPSRGCLAPSSPILYAALTAGEQLVRNSPARHRRIAG